VRWRSHDRFGTDGLGVRLPDAAVTGLQAVGAVVVLGALAGFSEGLLLFGALGATTFLQLANPLSAPASPRNTIVGHGVAFTAGLAGLAIFGLWDAGPAADSGVGADRVAAVAFALGVTITVLIAFDRQHLAAGASTVVIALGEVDDYFISGLGVLVLTLYSFVTNRLRGIPYPRWAPNPEVVALARKAAVAQRRAAEGDGGQPSA
jgi:CBS domain-containing membrane protein